MTGAQTGSTRPDVVLYASFPFAARVPLGDWQMGRALARQGLRVLYVDPPSTPQGFARSRRWPGPALLQVEPGLMTLRTWALSARRSSRLTASQNVAVDIQVRRTLLAGTGPLPWLLTMAPARGELRLVPRRRLVYWQKDRQYAAPGERREGAVYASHLRLLRGADVVTGVSDTLVSDGALHGVHVHLIRNGHDTSLAQPPPEHLVSGVDATPRPRIVLLGHLSGRVDHELFAELVARRPGYSFLLLGGSKAASVERLTLLGTVDPVHVHGLLSRCDVGVIPYVDSTFNRASNPLKLYDYLAASLSVIGSNVDLGGLESDAGPVWRADGLESWLAALDAAVKASTAPISAAAVLAREQSWDARAEQLVALLSSS